MFSLFTSTGGWDKIKEKITIVSVCTVLVTMITVFHSECKKLVLHNLQILTSVSLQLLFLLTQQVHEFYQIGTYGQ